MDVSGINKNMVNNTLDKAKATVSDGDFERRLKAAVENKDEKALKKVCMDFEGIMMNLVYKQMRATVPQTDLFGSDSGKEIFESMLDDKLMEKASEGGGIGLGEILFKQMKKSLKSGEKTESTTDPVK